MVDATGYEYVVVGSGPGGGTVAARLVENGHKVLLLEAGGDPLTLPGGADLPGSDRLSDDYSVPAFHPMATENDAVKWDFWVRHYEDDAAQKRDPKYYPRFDGVLYPRASALGGCSVHNAQIMIYPHNSDWDDIAKSVGDESWSAENMRRYFERMENCRHRPFWRLIAKTFGWNPLRHGFDGWLSVEKALPIAAVGDQALDKIIIRSARAEGLVAHAARRLREFFVALPDPNDWLNDEKAEGLHYVPLSTSNHTRRGTREFLLETAKRYPDRLTIELDALATKVLLEKASDGTFQATGVQYLKGARLYKACALPSTAQPEKRTVRVSREVILSAGAFNTPQLLMLSGIGPEKDLEKHDIKVRVALPGVGRNLQDRYEVGVVYRLKDEWEVLKGCDFTRNDPQYKKWAEWRAGVYTTNGIALALMTRSSRQRRLPDLFAFALTGQFRGYFPGYSKLPNQNYLTWAILKAHTENRAGTVTLNSDCPLDPPAVNFHYFKEGTNAGREDLESVVNGIKLVRRLTAPLGDVVADEALPGLNVQDQQALEKWVEAHAWGHHASCTCKIGPDGDKEAVLDKDFRVRGTKGLRVVDASVFPRIPGFFIVSAVYMIGEKASDAILRDAERDAETSAIQSDSSAYRKVSRLREPEGEGAMHRIGPIVSVAVLLALLALLSSFLASPQAVGTVDQLSQQLDRLSFLPQSAFPFLIILLGLDLLLTLVHSLQELKGRMWRYVGAIAGVRIPDAWGYLFFFLALTAVLWLVGFAAIVGYPFTDDLTQNDFIRMAAVGALIGLRLSDRWNLHIKLDGEGYRPNPGLPSTPYYLAEAVLLAILFLPGLSAWPYGVLGATIGFAIGWLFFYSVVPLVRSLKIIFPALRRDPWKSGEPIPGWAH